MILYACPAVQHVLKQAVALRKVACCQVLINRCNQLASGIAHHGLAQAAQCAAANYFGHGCYGAAQFNGRALVDCVPVVGTEPNIVNRAYGAAGCCVGAGLSVFVTELIRVGACIGVSQFDFPYACISQAEQFACVGLCVGIGVFPHAQ